jgi:ribonuclease Z
LDRRAVRHLYAAFSEDRRIRIEGEHYPLTGISVDAHEFVAAGKVFERNGVLVSAFPVFHGEHIEPAFGFKVEYKEHAVVLSGDTKYSKRVESEATGAGLLIAAISGDNEKVFAQFPIYRTVMDHHTNPEEAGRLFSNAKPRLAVYSHIVVLSNPKAGVADATPQEIVAQTRRTYDGPLMVGEHMMQFRVTAEAVQQLKIGANP